MGAGGVTTATGVTARGAGFSQYQSPAKARAIGIAYITPCVGRADVVCCGVGVDGCGAGVVGCGAGVVGCTTSGSAKSSQMGSVVSALIWDFLFGFFVTRTDIYWIKFFSKPRVV